MLGSGAAVMWYPPSMKASASDPGSVTAVSRDAKGIFHAYLNATPKQGNETLANFASFRVAHQREDVAASVTEIARASNVRFRGGTGTCVTDIYVTRAKHNSYREIACFVKGKGPGTVIVAAAPPTDWVTMGPLLKTAVAAYQAR